MSGAGARLPVVPTVTVLGMVKIRLVAAKKGHQLLKKKARAHGNNPGWWPWLAGRPCAAPRRRAASRRR
jgi:hypothetical protein